jgi:hypothetical protein
MAAKCSQFQGVDTLEGEIVAIVEAQPDGFAVRPDEEARVTATR